MAITLEDLKRLLDGEGLRYFIDPSRPLLMLGFAGAFGRFQFVISLENDGEFVQLRTVGYLHCLPDHPQIDKVLRAIADANFRYRFVKFGWDESDGEIVGYGDHWIEDASLSAAQLSQMIKSFASTIDMTHHRLERIMEGEEDPGGDLMAVLQAGVGSSGLPEALRKLIEKLAEASGDDDSDDDSGDSSEVPDVEEL